MGATGAQGIQGTTGMAGAGVTLMASVLNPSNAISFFFSPSAAGDATVGGTYTDYTQVAVPIPFSCSFDSMYIAPSQVPSGYGVGGVVTTTLYIAGSATALTASGDSSAGTGGSITGQSVAVTAGQTIAVQASGAGLPIGQGIINVSMHCQ
jgi:hypothetical protein